jgi:hypothetical protein
MYIRRLPFVLQIRTDFEIVGDKKRIHSACQTEWTVGCPVMRSDRTQDGVDLVNRFAPIHKVDESSHNCVSTLCDCRLPLD